MTYGNGSQLSWYFRWSEPKYSYILLQLWKIWYGCWALFHMSILPGSCKHNLWIRKVALDEVGLSHASYPHFTSKWFSSDTTFCTLSRPAWTPSSVNCLISLFLKCRHYSSCCPSWDCGLESTCWWSVHSRSSQTFSSGHQIGSFSEPLQSIERHSLSLLWRLSFTVGPLVYIWSIYWCCPRSDKTHLSSS